MSADRWAHNSAIPYLGAFFSGLLVADLLSEPVVLASYARAEKTGFGLIVIYGLIPMFFSWGLNLIVFKRLRNRFARSNAWNVAIRQAIAGTLVFIGLTAVNKLAEGWLPVALLVLSLLIPYVIYRYFGGEGGSLSQPQENA